MTTTREYQRVIVEINIPVTFTPQYVDYQKSLKGFGDQIRVKTTEGQLLYLPLDMAAVLVETGVLTPAGLSRFGDPAWTVANPHRITYTRRDRGKLPDVAINGQPFIPTVWREVGQGPSGVAKPQTDMVSLAKQLVGFQPTSPSAPPSKRATVVDAPTDTLDQWAVLEATLAKCADIVLRVWAQRFVEVTNLTDGATFEGLTAQTATLMISADKRGLRAIPSVPPPSREEMAELPEVIRKGQNDDQDLPF